MSEDLYAALQRTVDAVVAAYSSPEPWNPEQIWATRANDCLHYIHPVEAIPPEFRVAIDKDHHIQSLRFLGPVLDSFELDLKDAVIDVKTRTAVIRLTAKYNLLAVGNEGPDHGLTTDFMWLMEMDEEGKRIKRVEEYLDQSSFLAVVIERATKYAESKE